VVEGLQSGVFSPGGMAGKVSECRFFTDYNYLCARIVYCRILVSYKETARRTGRQIWKKQNWRPILWL